MQQKHAQLVEKASLASKWEDQDYSESHYTTIVVELSHSNSIAYEQLAPQGEGIAKESPLIRTCRANQLIQPAVTVGITPLD